MEVAETLNLLKKECTILVVSHDLREISPLVTAQQSTGLASLVWQCFVFFCKLSVHVKLVNLLNNKSRADVKVHRLKGSLLFGTRYFVQPAKTCFGNMLKESLFLGNMRSV